MKKDQGGNEHGGLYCLECNEGGFRSRSSLLEHRKIHESQSQYRCHYPGCTSSYQSLKRLSNHRISLNHHVLEEEKIKYVSCPICKSKFSRESNMKRHLALKHPSSEIYGNYIFNQGSCMYFSDFYFSMTCYFFQNLIIVQVCHAINVSTFMTHSWL